MLLNADEELKARVHSLEVMLVNAMEDNVEYRTEYERIVDEGKLLHTTYASKVNQLKQMAAQNVRLQAEATGAREREQRATRELEHEREEAVKWRAKLKEQSDRFRDAFASLERMKKQAADDAATIKRLQKGALASSHSNLNSSLLNVSVNSSSVSETVDTERRYKAKVAALERRVDDLRQRLESGAEVSATVAAMDADALRMHVERLTSINEVLREDNKELLLESARAGDGKHGTQARALDGEAARLKAELEAAHAREAEHSTRARDLEASVAALRAQLDDAQRQRQDVAQSVGREYGARLAVVTKERESWQSRAELLEALLNDAVTTDSSQVELAAKLHATAQRLVGDMQALAVSRAQVEQQRALVAAREAAVGTMEERTQEYAEHVERVEDRCTSLVRALSQAEQLAAEAEARSVAAAHAEEAARARLSALTLQRDELARELEDQRALCRDMEEVSRDAEELTASLQQRLANADRERETAVLAADAALRTMCEERDELKILSGQLFEASQTAQAEAEERDAELQRVRVELDAALAALDKQQGVARELHTCLDRRVAEHHRVLDAKAEEASKLRALLEAARDTQMATDDAERARRADWEARLAEAEREADVERAAAKAASEQLVALEADSAVTRRLLEVVRNECAQLQLVQEALAEVLEQRGARCCCAELRAMAEAVRASGETAEAVVSQQREVAKLQAVVDQQNRYISDAKTKSNVKIRLLHAQLTEALAAKKQ